MSLVPLTYAIFFPSGEKAGSVTVLCSDIGKGTCSQERAAPTSAPLVEDSFRFVMLFNRLGSSRKRSRRFCCFYLLSENVTRLRSHLLAKATLQLAQKLHVSSLALDIPRRSDSSTDPVAVEGQLAGYLAELRSSSPGPEAPLE